MRSKPVAGRGRLLARLFLFTVLLLAVAFFTRDRWLLALGNFLILDEPPLRAEAVLVLAGDDRGDRVRKAAELALGGFGSPVYISGSGNVYGRSYAELARDFAVAKGYPPSTFRIVQHDADSTREEAVILLDRLRADRVRRFNLVTSDFHTRRTRRVFDPLARDFEFRVVAAPTWNFSPNDWWRARPSQKVVFLEYTKTLADYFGI
jgi:uncharacterized SAM-binding protein YcdF (DUF218 family)